MFFRLTLICSGIALIAIGCKPVDINTQKDNQVLSEADNAPIPGTKLRRSQADALACARATKDGYDVQHLWRGPVFYSEFAKQWTVLFSNNPNGMGSLSFVIAVNDSDSSTEYLKSK